MAVLTALKRAIEAIALEAWKIQGFNGAQTHDFAIPVLYSNQLSYEALKDWAGHLSGSIPSRDRRNQQWKLHMKWVIYMNCGHSSVG